MRVDRHIQPLAKEDRLGDYGLNRNRFPDGSKACRARPSAKYYRISIPRWRDSERKSVDYLAAVADRNRESGA